jgi:2-oxoglutarate ferredoxin oxidoreductase subunit delta
MKVYQRTPLNLDRMVVPRGRVFVIPARCKGCNICIQFCPMQVLQESKGQNVKGYHYPEIAEGKEEACVHCQFCMIVCPEFAIYTDAGEEVVA